MNSFFECLSDTFRSTPIVKATNIIKRRPTRRGKKKPKVKSAKWLREFEEAKKQQALIKQQAKERAIHVAEFNRHIYGE